MDPRDRIEYSAIVDRSPLVLPGVPHRIKYLERMLEEIAAKPGVVFWSGSEILGWHREASSA